MNIITYLRQYCNQRPYRKQILFLLPFLLFGGISLLIMWLNYIPKTYLMGGDNLMPELSPMLNLKRSVFATWQEYQGVGVHGGMGYATDITRQMLIIIASWFIHPSAIRYLSTSSCLFIGSLGTYFLTRYLFFKDNKTIIGYISAYCAGLFYLLNPATVQTFYVPYEAFIFHFAFLPWIILSSIMFLTSFSKHTYLLLVLTFILGMTQWFVPTLFVTFCGSLFLLIICFLLSKNALTLIKKLRRIGVLLLTILMINAFWLFPFLYYATHDTQITVDAKISQMATQAVFDKNKEFGHLQDVIQLRSFWFNNIEPDLQGKPQYMLLPLKHHLTNLFVESSLYLFFFLSCVGLYSLLKKRDNLSFPQIWLILLFISSFCLLVTATPPLSYLSDFLRNHIPLFNQVFRFPFTKFITVFTLSYACLIGVGLYNLLSMLPASKKGRLVTIGNVVIIILLIVYTVFPIFQGHLFYQKNRVTLPTSYQQVFTFFANQNPTTRIAYLPQYTYWGWLFTSWNYSGSGFLWYGIEQPILDNNFAMWSKENENFFSELNYTILSKNPYRFSDVLSKYDVDWLVVDKNILSSSASQTAYFPTLDSFLKQHLLGEKVASYGDISIYKVEQRNKRKSFISAASSLPSVNSYQYTDYDLHLTHNTSYITTAVSPEIMYPFRSLYTTKLSAKHTYTLTNFSHYFQLTSAPFSIDANSSFTIPSFLDNEELLPVTFFSSRDEKGNITVFLEPLLPTLSANNYQVSFSNPKVKLFSIPASIAQNSSIDLNINGKIFADIANEYFHAEDTLATKETNLAIVSQGDTIIDQTTFSPVGIKELLEKPISTVNLGKQDNLIFTAQIPHIPLISFPLNTDISPEPCDSFRIGTSKQTHTEKGYLLENQNSSSCLSFAAASLTHNTSYLVSIAAENISGSPLHFWVENQDTKTVPIDIFLTKNNKQPYHFILPPFENDGKGYVLHLDNTSLGDPSKNILNNVEIFSFPYHYFENLYFSHPSPSKITTTLPENVSHPNESMYKITNFPENIQYLLLSQGYHSGWQAYSLESTTMLSVAFPFLFGEKLQDHVMINNWANGWKVDASPVHSSIVVIFLPQYLQYLGYSLLFSPFVVLIFSYTSHRKKPKSPN